MCHIFDIHTYTYTNNYIHIISYVCIFHCEYKCSRVVYNQNHYEYKHTCEVDGRCYTFVIPHTYISSNDFRDEMRDSISKANTFRGNLRTAGTLLASMEDVVCQEAPNKKQNSALKKSDGPATQEPPIILSEMLR